MPLQKGMATKFDLIFNFSQKIIKLMPWWIVDVVFESFIMAYVMDFVHYHRLARLNVVLTFLRRDGRKLHEA